MILGVVGGLAGIIWALMGYSLGDYEQFKYDTSLVGSIYPTSPGGGSEETPDAPDAVVDERSAKKKLM